MKVLITYPALLVATICLLAGLAPAEPAPTSSEPEPVSMCFGAEPICIGGHACCRCEIGGINCVWACCD